MKSKIELFLKKALKLNARKILFTIIIWGIAILLHNVISFLFSVEEPFFFIIAIIIIPTYFALALIYNLIKFFRNKGD